MLMRAVMALAVAMGPVTAAAQTTTTFRDDANTSSWAENTGTADFSAGWNRSGTTSRSGGEIVLSGNNTTASRSLNLAAFDIASLSFRVRSLGVLESGDELRVEAAPTSGGAWREVASFADDTASTDVTRVISAEVAAGTTVRFRVDGTTQSGEAWAIDFVEVQAVQPGCFQDNFSTASLSTNDWATNSVSGSFGQPRIEGGRLRLTDASGSVSTAASLLRLFPGADNRVVLEFDYLAYNGSGADGVAFTLSDATVAPVAGGFGGSLGYAQRDGVTPGFAGGWLGVGIDEFGNFSNPTESRVGGPGFRADAVALRGSGSGLVGYPYIGGTNSLTPGVDVSGATPGPNHRYRITVDNRAGVVAGARVSVERRTTPTGAFTTLVAPFDIFVANPDQAPVPANFRLSLTGSTGGSTNVHELDNLSVCATRVNQIVEVDHYRFFHDGQGLTCGPESIRVVACRNATCTQEVSGPLQVTLAPSGWVGGDVQTITSGQTLQLRRTTPGDVTLAVTASNPPRRPFTPDRCFIGGTPQANCSFNFADSGFAFDVPNHDADAPQSVVLSAVRRDDATQACVPGFANVTRSILFGSTYQNPTTGTAAVRVNGNEIAAAGSPATPLSLAFDANGRSTISVQYADAGSMRLLARYAGSSANGDAGLVMEGQDDFVARPILHLEVTAPANPAAADSSGGVFTVAGQPFATRVTARNVNGAVTANFGRETTPDAVDLRSTLVAPVGGNNPAPTGSFGATSAGVSIGNWQWDEVGVIGLAAHLRDNDYLGAGDLSRPSAAVVPRVGRFRPARLQVVANTPSFAAACAAGAFTYVGQEFGFATAPELTVTALNAQGATTGNYVNAPGPPTGQFWRLSGSLAGRGYSNAAAATAATLSRTTTGSAYQAQGITASPFDGQGVLRPSDPLQLDRLTYTKPPSPEAPFATAVAFRVPAADLRDSDGACFDPNTDGSCDDFVLATPIGGTMQRWGRIVVANAFGPELLDLAVPMRAEFFSNGGFVLNTNDACSVVGGFGLVDPNPADGLVPGETCVQDGGAPGTSGLGCAAAGPPGRRYTAAPVAGQYVLWLRAPGAGNVGVLDLTPTLPAWLQFNWTGSGSAAPTARIGFGVYQGDRRAIHEREVY